MTEHPLRLNAGEVSRRVLFICLTVELLILLLDLLVVYFQLIDSSSLRKIFNVAREQSLGTWFSVVQAAAVGATLLGLYWVSKLQGARPYGWLSIALFFFYISADDAAKIHERVGGYMGKLAEAEQGTVLSTIAGFTPSYNWQWVFLPFFAVAGLLILFYLWRQLTNTKLRLVIMAAFGCWVVAVGIDFVEGIDGLFESIAESLEVKRYTVSHPFLMLEEFLEMFGTSLFLYVFLHQLINQLNDFLFDSYPGRN